MLKSQQIWQDEMSLNSWASLGGLGESAGEALAEVCQRETSPGNPLSCGLQLLEWCSWGGRGCVPLQAVWHQGSPSQC